MNSVVVNKLLWLSIVRQISSMDVLSLCKEFDELSIDDSQPSSSSPHERMVQYPLKNLARYSSRLLGFARYSNTALNSLNPSPWCMGIMDRIRAPFIDIPSNIFNSNYLNSNLLMALGFRFMPGQNDFLSKELLFSEDSLEKIGLLFNSVGLTYYKMPVLEKFLLTKSSLANSLIMNEASSTSDISKILVETATTYDGHHFRSLILVCMGIGCTVWYRRIPVFGNQDPVDNEFFQLLDYSQFNDLSYRGPSSFSRFGILEREDVSSTVESVMGQKPFADFTIPATGPVLKAVGFGLMISFFLTVGMLPNLSRLIDKE